MNRDYTYCSGVTCEIRQSCKRYIPDSPDMVLWWMNPEYDKESKQCNNYQKEMKIRTLDLVLKHKWYDMIESGEKTEEYIEIKPYWIRRINSVGKQISHVRFRKGYSKTSMMFRIDKVIATFGRPEWGAPKGRAVYVIKLGERIN